MVSLHPGVTRQRRAEDLWLELQSSPKRLTKRPAPSELELKTLRDLQARTKAAHEGTGKAKAA